METKMWWCTTACIHQWGHMSKSRLQHCYTLESQKSRCTWWTCGLFAIATATALAHGIQPGACSFKQNEMRRHLYKCLEKGTLTPFPLFKERRAGSKVKYMDTIPIYCTCRMPENAQMVQCSRCAEWFHVDCVNPPQSAIDDSKVDWYCNFCWLYCC